MTLIARYRDLSIVYRTMLIVGLLAIMMMLILYFMLTSSIRLEDRREHAVVNTLLAYGESLRVAVQLPRNQALLAHLRDQIQREGAITQIVLVKKDGARELLYPTFESFHKQNKKAVLLPYYPTTAQLLDYIDHPIQVSEDERIIHFYKPIQLSDAEPAMMLITAKMPELSTNLVYYLAEILGLCFLIAIFFSFRLQHSLTYPLYNLVSTMIRIAESKNFSLRIESNRKDEFGQLADGFNAMIGRLEHLDVEEKKETKIRLEKLAYYDALTGLPNRSLFKELLNFSLKNAARTNTSVALFFMDLDNFKIINDQFGHDVGDILLNKVSKILDSLIRENDTLTQGLGKHVSDLARLGGDEFTACFNNLTSDEDVENIAKRIINALQQPIEIAGKKVSVGCSIGIAMYPLHGKDANELLRNADIAMYDAKKSGRNNYRVFDEQIAKDFSHYADIEIELDKALLEHQFELHYQQKIDISTKKVLSVEALLRWRHPTLGLMTPDSFIKIAEQSGDIINIGEWVIQQACMDCRRWQYLCNNSVSVSVDVTLLQLEDEYFVDKVKSALRQAHLDAYCLELELTEDVLMQNDPEIIKRLNALSDYGVKLSVDDFGAGYSAFKYISQFPLDTLKIDRHFIQNIESNPRDLAIVKSIITFAHNLDLDVVAEGVETQAQYRSLCTTECDEIQGYFVSEPVTFDEHLSHLMSGRKAVVHDE